MSVTDNPEDHEKKDRPNWAGYAWGADKSTPPEKNLDAEFGVQGPSEMPMWNPPTDETVANRPRPIRMEKK